MNTVSEYKLIHRWSWFFSYNVPISRRRLCMGCLEKLGGSNISRSPSLHIICLLTTKQL